MTEMPNNGVRMAVPDMTLNGVTAAIVAEGAKGGRGGHAGVPVPLQGAQAHAAIG